MSNTLVSIKDLKTYFYTEDGVVKAVDGVSFDIKKGQTIGVVGESGCGKSITAMSLMRLIPNPPGKIVGGEIDFDGIKILDITERDMRKIRGNDISVIFQEPMTSLNPVFTIGDQLSEAIILHQGLNKSEAREKSIDSLKLVGIPRADEIVDCFPHELSGGMRQRAMIAMAMSCEPKLLIADEPTTALDVTIQAQILDLMRDLKTKTDAAIMMITHDLGVVAEMCEHIIVMYAGKVVEEADVHELYANPKHPYTRGLMKSRPMITEDKERLDSIPGQVPNPIHMPTGCAFHPRCGNAMDICKKERPILREVAPGHKAACWLYEEGK